MTTQTYTLSDETRIHHYEWIVPQSKATLLLVHGYAEHAMRYEHFAAHLNAHHINVVAYDQRGHGKSGGLKAYIPKFEMLIDDLAEVRKRVSGPIFLMGHSMGGGVAVRYAITKHDPDLKGLISCSAALEIDKDLSPLLQKLAPILGAIFPKLPTTPLDKRYITRRPEVLEDYINDPLTYTGGTRARTGAELLKSIKVSQTMFDKMTKPLLVLHGTLDRLTMPSGSKKLYDAASSTDKTLKLYEGLYHELVNEPEREEVMAYITDWILKRA